MTNYELRITNLRQAEVDHHSVVKLAEGEHRAEPLIVESGKRSAHIVLEAGAKLHLAVFVVDTEKAPNKTVQQSLTIDLVGEGASVDVHGLFAVSKGSANIDVVIRHLAPDCTSRQLIKGIASGSATGSFRGTIFVARDSQRTDAEQYSRNIQLSDSARIVTQPRMEIYADDVKCSHGATVGKLDEEAVFYMRSRGIGEAQARRLQLEGFAAEIINLCPSEDSRKTITTAIDRALGL